MPDLTDPTAERRRAEAIDTAGRHADRMVTAYGWLLVLTEPGREPRAAPRLLSDTQRAESARQAAAEAADRRANLRAGLTAGPASGAPLQLGMVHARTRAVGAVAHLVGEVDARLPPQHRFGPVTAATVPAALDWLAGPGPARWATSTAGVTRRRGVLVDVDVPLVVRAGDRLARAADEARAAAGIVTDRVAPYPVQPCPACRRRSLEIDATLRNERYWTVRCISASCVCLGSICGCRRRGTILGRQHAWSWGELPMLAWAQDQHRRSYPVRSATVGHGGWAERRLR